MSTYTLFLLFGLLLVTFSVLPSTQIDVNKVSRCVDGRTIFRPGEDDGICEDWRQWVQQYQESHAKVFKNYPGLTNAIGETVITAFKIYSDRLTSWTTCNSTILSTRSIAILQAFTLLSTSGKSASYLVNENAKATPSLVPAYTKIVSELSDNIGELVYPINDIIVHVGKSFDIITKEFQNRFVERNDGNDEKINFKPLMKCAELLTNTIGLIAETAVYDCDSATISADTYDAIAILICILNDCFLSIQGIMVSMAAVLLSESSELSDYLQSCLHPLDPFIRGVGDAIASMTLDNNPSVRALLTKVVSLMSPLNEAFDNLLGPFEGAKINVGQIKINLLKPDSGSS